MHIVVEGYHDDDGYWIEVRRWWPHNIMDRGFSTGTVKSKDAVITQAQEMAAQLGWKVSFKDIDWGDQVFDNKNSTGD